MGLIIYFCCIIARRSLSKAWGGQRPCLNWPTTTTTTTGCLSYILFFRGGIRLIRPVSYKWGALLNYFLIKWWDDNTSNEQREWYVRICWGDELCKSFYVGWTGREPFDWGYIIICLLWFSAFEYHFILTERSHSMDISSRAGLLWESQFIAILPVSDNWIRRISSGCKLLRLV